MTRVTKTCLAVVAAAAMPATAFAGPGDSAGFQISLTIPEVCQLEAPGVIVDQGAGQAMASVFEMCNSGRGFRVVASHRALEPGEHVAVNYAGQQSELSASGISDLAFRTGPMVREVPVQFQTQGLVGSIAISIGMMAI